MNAPSPSNSEWLTRKRLIDPKLKSAGWKITPFSPEKPLPDNGAFAIEEFETTNGPADDASPWMEELLAAIRPSVNEGGWDVTTEG